MPASVNCLIVQSGGPSAALNASASGLIAAAIRRKEVKGIWAAANGFEGILEDRIFDLRAEKRSDLRALGKVPGAALGSSRRSLSGEGENDRALNVLRARGVRWLFVIGGNDTMQTALELDCAAEASGYELSVVGVPKTIDNDLEGTDHCPGYGSAAKYLATIVMEAGRDTESTLTTDRVSVIEAMGRDSGWLAAATALGRRSEEDPPHIVLLPERPFDPEKFCLAVEAALSRLGRCVVVAAEGLKDSAGDYLSAEGGLFADGFGHAQLGGAALAVKSIVETRLRVKTRFAIPSIVQRSGGHWASAQDLRESTALGRPAMEVAAAGGGRMLCIRRLRDEPYRWAVGSCSLDEAAGRVRRFPAEWLGEGGMDIRSGFLRYLKPLVAGRVGVELLDGIPKYIRLKKNFI
jgi:6-phosphofructokinase 1